MSNNNNLNTAGQSQSSSLRENQKAMAALWLNEKEWNDLVSLFSSFVEQKNNSNGKNTWNNNIIPLMLVNEEFLKYAKTKRGDIFDRIKQFLGREAKLQDLSFLVVDTDTVSKQHGVVLLGMQLAYVDKYDKVLKNKKYSFTDIQKKSFEKDVVSAVDGKIHMDTFLRILFDWKDQASLTPEQSRAFDNTIKYISANDIAHAMKNSSLISDEDKNTLSHTGAIGEKNELEKTIAEITEVYMKNKIEKDERAYDRMNNYAQAFNMPWFGQVISHVLGWDKEIDAIPSDEVMKKLETANADVAKIVKWLSENKWDISLCSRDLQKSYFVILKNYWIKSPSFAVTRNHIVEDLKLLDEKQFNVVVDSLYDIDAKTLDIPLKNGDKIHINTDKELGAAPSDIPANPIEAMSLGIPLVIRVSYKDVAEWEDKGELYNLSNEKAFPELVSMIGANVAYAQQSVDEDKKNAEEMQSDKLWNNVDEAIKKWNKENVENKEKNKWYEELKNIWNGLQWKQDIELDGKNGNPQLFLRYDEKHIWQFGGSFVRCEITKIDKSTWQISLKIFGVTGELTQVDPDDGNTTQLEWKELTYSPEWFQKFLDGTWDEKIKMPPVQKNTMRNWGEKLKWDLLGGKYAMQGWIEKWLNTFIKEVDFSSLKKQDPNGKKEPEHIKYMGRAITSDAGNPDWKDKADWYKVDFSHDGVVKLTQPMWPDAKPLTMNYDTFLLFSADKGLNTFSQEDVDEINTLSGSDAWKNYIDQWVAPGMQDQDILNKNRKKWLFGWGWTSINAIKSQYKKIAGDIKKKLETKSKDSEDRLAGVVANAWWAKKLSSAWIPVLSEVMMEITAPAASQSDRGKKEKIDKFAKEPEDYKDTTPGGSYDYIEAVLFKSPLKDARANLLRVAWYFQFCCSKWDLYARSLAKYAGKGKWIELLLGTEWKNEYLRWFAEQQELSKKNPDDIDLHNRVMYGEAYFLSKVVGDGNYTGASKDTDIVDAGNVDPKTNKPKLKSRKDVILPELQSIYSKAWIWGALDTLVAGWIGSAGSIRKKKEDLLANEKENFTSLYAEVFANFEGKSLTGAMGHLEPLAKKMWLNEEYYRKRWMAMLYPLLSWQTRGLTDTAIGTEYMSLWRKYSFPLSLYAWGTPNGREELVTLLTLFEKKAGYPHAGTWNKFKPIAEIIKTLGDKSDQASLKEFTKDLKARWGDENPANAMWQTALKIMTSPQSLFDLEQELVDNKIKGTTIDSQQAKNYSKVLWDYMDKKFMDTDQWDLWGDVALHALSLKKNVWSLSPGFMNTFMWSKNGKQFNSKVIENVPGIWTAFTTQLKLYENRKDNLSAREVQFLMNKFTSLTDGKLRGSWSEQDFLYAMYAPNTISFQPVAGKGNKQSPWLQSDGLPPIEWDVLARYIIRWADGKSITWENLPPVIRDNLKMWVSLFHGESFKKELPGLIQKGRLKMFEDQKGTQQKIDSQKRAGIDISTQATNYFSATGKFGSLNRKLMNDQFGDWTFVPVWGWYYNDDDDDWYGSFWSWSA